MGSLRDPAGVEVNLCMFRFVNATSEQPRGLSIRALHCFPFQVGAKATFKSSTLLTALHTTKVTRARRLPHPTASWGWRLAQNRHESRPEALLQAVLRRSQAASHGGTVDFEGVRLSIEDPLVRAPILHLPLVVARLDQVQVLEHLGE